MVVGLHRVRQREHRRQRRFRFGQIPARHVPRADVDKRGQLGTEQPARVRMRDVAIAGVAVARVDVADLDLLERARLVFLVP